MYIYIYMLLTLAACKLKSQGIGMNSFIRLLLTNNLVRPY